MAAAAAAVLRVKRKRGAEAAEALLLACKRPRTAGELALGEQVVRTLFRLAATVGSQDDSIQRHIKKAISKDKALLAVNPSSTSSQRVQLSLRASQQAASQEGRYKVIASHRRNALKFQLGDEKNDQETGSEISQPQDEGGGNGQKNSSTSSGSSKDVVGSGKEIQVFDVQHEDNKADSKHIHIKDSGPGQYDPETILCNSVKMIREKLTVSNCGLGTEHRENMEEYVYDIYYTDGYISRGGIEDILSVVPYHKEHELMSDELIGDETYEDEDDENDENNWRNDYPDEDDWNSEEDMEKQDGPFSSEEEDRLNF